MNMIDKNRAVHSDDIVGDIVIPAEDLERLYAERKAERQREKRRSTIKKLLSGTAVTFLAGLAFAEAVIIAGLLPLKEIVPLVVYQRDDGTFSNHVRWESLPQAVREDTTINVVWNYVMLRESWSPANAGYAWTVVSAMSAPKVRENFQSWYRADNPQSPSQTYKDVTVEARYVRWEPVCPVEKVCINEGAPAYRIWFDRIETLPDGKRTPPVRYAVTVGIRRNVEIPEDKIWQRWTFNAPQVQVVEYPGAQREGVSR